MLITINDLPGKLMQGIRPATGDLAMDARGLAFMAAALG